MALPPCVDSRLAAGGGGFACLPFWGRSWNVQYEAAVVRILVRMRNASFSLLFPGGFEFAPGPWVGNSWCLLASVLGRNAGF